MKRIAIWWHVTAINNWEDIYAEQVGKMILSGLWREAAHVNIGLLGASKRLSVPEGGWVIHSSTNILEYEIATIKKMDEWVRGLERPEEWCVFYLHLKGAGRREIDQQFNASFWRRYMEYFTIERWRDCHRAMDYCDACGVDMNLNPWPHFSGNFWWATASYLRTLPPASGLSSEDPVRAELRIGESSRQMALHGLWQSGVNLYQHKYLPSEYRGKAPLMPQGAEECA